MRLGMVLAFSAITSPTLITVEAALASANCMSRELGEASVSRLGVQLAVPGHTVDRRVLGQLVYARHLDVRVEGVGALGGDARESRRSSS